MAESNEEANNEVAEQVEQTAEQAAEPPAEEAEGTEQEAEAEGTEQEAEAEEAPAQEEEQEEEIVPPPASEYTGKHSPQAQEAEEEAGPPPPASAYSGKYSPVEQAAEGEEAQQPVIVEQGEQPVEAKEDKGDLREEEEVADEGQGEMHGTHELPDDGIPPPPNLFPGEQEQQLTPSSMALNLQWSFGFNKNVPVINLTDEHRDMIAYACAHTGVLYDYKNNEQYLLQGHSNNITCMCTSRDKRWLATADVGDNNLIIVWDTYNGSPVRTVFDPCPESGIRAMAMTPDAKYLATLTDSEVQTLSVWDWTTGDETPVCTADLKASYGKQAFLLFNPDENSQIFSSSETQCIFYAWDKATCDIKYYAPPLTDDDFNRPVGKFTQSVFLKNSTRMLTGTTLGNLVVWDNNKPLSKLNQYQKPTPDKKAVKLVKQIDKAILVLTTSAEDYVVTGDSAGHIRFFDQKMKLLSWYQDFKLGPINAVSFAYLPDFYRTLGRIENTDFPPDATIAAKKFVLRRFIVGTTNSVCASVKTDGTDVKIIHRDHDASVYAIDTHPFKTHLVIGSYSALLQLWDYSAKVIVTSRHFDRKELIRVATFSPKGGLIAVGFSNGMIRLLDSLTLADTQPPFREAREAVFNLAFSHDENFIASTDAQYTTSLFTLKTMMGEEMEGSDQGYYLLGRYRAHYKTVVDLSFGIILDCDQPRLLTLGEDRQLVEYDLQKSVEENQIVVMSSERIEQTAFPMCMTWYPPLGKEHFIITANNQYKIKLYNTTTKMCRKTVLGPIYGSPIQKILVLPTKDPHKDIRFLVYITVDKVGLVMLPVDGNPFKAMALFAHPQGVTNVVASNDGRFVFTAGGLDSTVHMWEINKPCLEAQAQIGGQGVMPYYTLLEGGEEGDLHKELENYFYYAQLRSQGLNTMDKRLVSSKIPVAEVPFVMRALGYYPSEQEIQEMLNEIKFSDYVETGEYKTEIGLDDFIKLYVNHRPAFGLRPDELLHAFQVLGDGVEPLPNIDRGELLDMLQNRGEPMTENELAECLTTLMGFNEEGGAAEEHEFDPTNAGELINEFLPLKINADSFANQLLGLGLNAEVLSEESLKMLHANNNNSRAPSM